MNAADLDTGLMRRLVRNMTIQMGSQVVGAVLGLITTGVLASRLEQEEVGGFVFLFSFLYFFQALSDLGTSQTLVREVAQAPERTKELVQNILGLRLVLGTAAVIIGWIILAIDWQAMGFQPLSSGYSLSLKVFLLILPLQAFTVPAVVLQVRLQQGRNAIVEIINRGTGFVLMMLSVWMGHGLLFLTISLLLAEIVAACVLACFTYQIVPPIPRFDRRVWWHTVKVSLPLSGNSLLVAVLNRFDSVMLNALGGLSQVALYGLAYRLPNLFERVPQLIMVNMLPVMSRRAAADPIGLRRAYRRMQSGLALMIVPMVGGVMLLAPYIVRFWFVKPEYAAVVPLLRIAILSTAFVYLGISAGTVLVALNKTKGNVTAMAIGTVVNLVLNFFWIPRYGATGAAWATVVSFGVLAGTTALIAEMAITAAIERHRAEAA